jgi:hypothetical protein
MAPPPHGHKISISVQLRWCNNSLFGDHQCTYCLIVHALTISNFGFLVALAVLTKKTLFREVINYDNHENILLLALHTLAQHGNGAVSMPR